MPPPYQIPYHAQGYLPLQCRRRSNVWRRRGNNRTYVRPGWHYHPYTPPQQRRYSDQRLEDVEPRYYYIPGDADVDIEIDFGTDFDLTLYGCTPGAEAEVAITYLPPVDAPEDDDDDDDDEVEDCPICLDEMRPEDRVNPTAKLPCGHPFHADCIMKWLCNGDHNTCPICRYELPPDE